MLRLTATLHGRKLVVHVNGPATGTMRVSYTCRYRRRSMRGGRGRRRSLSVARSEGVALVRRNFRNSWWRCRGRHSPITLPSRVFSAANMVVVPLRLVVDHHAGATFLHRQAGLGAIECLDLALLVHAQHQRLLRRVQIQPDDVRQLLGKQRIVGELERLDEVGFKAMCVPDPLHCGRAHALGFGHRPAAPMSLTRRCGLGGRPHYLLDLLRGDRSLAATAGLDLPQRLRTIRTETLAPQDYCRARDPKFLCDRTVRNPVAAHQHDPCPRRHTLWGPMRIHPSFEQPPLLLRNLLSDSTQRHSRDATAPTHHVKLFPRHYTRYAHRRTPPLRCTSNFIRR